MLTKLSSISIPLSVFVAGLYGGIGFFTFMGGNPSLINLSSRTIAEYWQSIDSYMGARMPVFGPILLFTILFAIITSLPAWRTPSFWLLVAAFVILITDMVFAFSVNIPLNRVIQSWDIQNLPSNVQEVKAKVIRAFWFRGTFMLSSFICVVLAAFIKK
jgi:hypothetical protein